MKIRAEPTKIGKMARYFLCIIKLLSLSKIKIIINSYWIDKQLDSHY